ncbi:hypothetical protein Hdeb2414_s0004g00130351 [Helianthus debilis subsp. tardiflorus]
MEWMNIVYVLYHVVCLLTSYAMETDQVTLRASAFDTGVTGWYQSFDCSEPGFLLESSLQSLGSSHENGFTKCMVFIVYTKHKIHYPKRI